MDYQDLTQWVAYHKVNPLKKLPPEKQKEYEEKVAALRGYVTNGLPTGRKLTFREYWRLKIQLRQQMEGGLVTTDSLAQVFAQSRRGAPSADSGSEQS